MRITDITPSQFESLYRAAGLKPIDILMMPCEGRCCPLGLLFVQSGMTDDDDLDFFEAEWCKLTSHTADECLLFGCGFDDGFNDSYSLGARDIEEFNSAPDQMKQHLTKMYDHGYAVGQHMRKADSA